MTSVIAPAVPTKEPKEDANVAMPDVDPASAPLVRLEIFPANACTDSSVISFFQINSYWADQNNFNGVFGWLGIGIVTAAVAVFCLTKVSKYGGGGE